MPKKILLISQVFYPDQVSTANLFTGLCSLLSKDNTEVEVWSAQPSYTERKRQPKRVDYNGINIHYLLSTNFKKNNLPGRIINELTFITSASIKLLFSKDNTPVWTHTTPPALGILISQVCAFRNRKFIYIILDIFPEGLIRLGKVSGGNIFIKVWQKLFEAALKKSYKIIAIGRDSREFLLQLCNESEHKIEYIPLWQNDDLIFPGEFNANEFILKHDLVEKFIVQYSGNLGLWNEVKTMGIAVRKNIEDVLFIFVGGGIRKKELLHEFPSENPNNVILLPFQPNENLNNILNASHVHLVTLKEGLEGVAVPSKIFGILAAGKPVIAMVPDASEIAFIVSEEKCGIIVNPGDLDGLVNAILLLKGNESLRKEMGTNSRIAFEKKYTTKIIAEKYQSLIDNITLETGLPA